MPKLEKGEHAALNVTKEARHRILAGLGWDPNEKTGVLDKARAIAGGKKTWHDLDLSCFMYGHDKNFIDSVTADPGKAIDQTGRVYHSGDNVEGIGGGDDEQISVELKNLDDNIHHIVFMTTIKSGHNFGEVDVPEIRLADGYSNHNFLHARLNEGNGHDKSAFVFAHIYRTDGESWNIHNIDEFLNIGDTNDWAEHLKQYLKMQ